MKWPSKDSNLKKGKILFFSLMLILLNFSFMVQAYEKDYQDLEIDYFFEDIIIDSIEIDGFYYDLVSMPNCYTSGNPGEPDIPSFGAYILLPPNSNVDDIFVKTGDKIVVGSNFNIKPLGEVLPISEADKHTTLTADSAIYERNEYYPGNLFSKVGVYSFRGYDILVLLLHPVQYNPVTGELLYYNNIKISVDTSYEADLGLFRGLEKDKLEVKNKVDNPEIANMYSISSKPVCYEYYDLLILTTDSLQSGFEPLQTAHNTEGISTVIKTMTDVGGSSTEDVRNYIRDAYNNWGVDYVLLGGDCALVPYRELWVYGLDEGTDPYETYMPSDLYYGCLDGTYNYDGDAKWGEPTDGEGGGDVDLISDVYVGRACVDNINDVNNFVTKTVTYINKDPQLPYLSNACFIGEYMGNYGIATWGGNYMDQLIDVCSDDGYTTSGVPSSDYNIINLYDRDWAGNNWPISALMTVINDGAHFINHLGHSNYDYNMKMYYEDVYDFTNTDYCFIYSQGCMAGGFDTDWGDCFAEHCTVKTDNGAFAGIWNARYGWFWSDSTDGDSQRLHREFWDAVYGENIYEIGRVNSDSKEDNLAIIGRSCIRWCYYQTNLFGDPSLSFISGGGSNSDPDTPSIDGPLQGKPGKAYDYDFNIFDSDSENDLYLMIDWGDDTLEEWIGPFSNGVITEGHTWIEEGDYIIKAKVKDSHGAESDWGYLEIVMPMDHLYKTNFYTFLESYPVLFRLFQNFFNMI